MALDSSGANLIAMMTSGRSGGAGVGRGATGVDGDTDLAVALAGWKTVVTVGFSD